jgi:radical SAM superfamily enzyme YgiQ (UPF0313 family)
MIAAVLEENEHMVDILDLSILKQTQDTISETIKRKKPDIVGITATTPTISLAAAIAKMTKDADDDVTVVLGGPHASILPEDTLRNIPEVDIIVRGEGEKTIIELVNGLQTNYDMGKVLGITYRKGNEIKSVPSRPQISNIDELPFAALHLLPMNKYRLHPPFGRSSPCIPIITSRGCPYRCVFCSKSVFGKKFRANSPKYVADEIEYVIEKFGAKEIKFYDDVFTIDRNRVIDICKELKVRKIDILWTCETRVNLVNKELLETMRKSGCYMIEYGVESGCQEILNNLKKDTTLEQVEQAFKFTHAAGIQTVAYFMIGSPGDNPETIKKTLWFAKKLNPDFVTFATTTPYPGTELHDFAARNGGLSEEWDKYFYHWPGTNKPVSAVDTLSSKEIRQWVRRAHLSFYLRGSYVWKRLKKMKSLGEFHTNVAGLRMLFDLIK